MKSSPSSPAQGERARPGVEFALALLAGGLAYGVACLLVRPSGAVFGFGSEYQAMSERPFALVGALPQRLLAPLLAHVLWLDGAHYPLFAHGLEALVPATVFLLCRRRGARTVDAGLIALAVALTAPVQMYQRHWVGYPDPLGYALFFAALLAARRPVLFWGLFLANLLNHELALFLVPWLLYVRREAGGAWRADLLGLCAALAMYGAFYLHVKARAPDQVYGADHFLAHPLFPGGTFVVVLLALVHLLVAFGPVLVAVAWHQHARAGERAGWARERWHLWLVLAGIGAIFCTAFDWQRHANLIVMPFVIAALRFTAAGHRALFAGLVALGAALMSWISPWDPVTWPTQPLLQAAYAEGVVVLGHPGYGFGSLDAALGGWLPAVAPILGVCLVLLALVWLAGAWLARRERA
jgi:hypothetical protein